ncbi:MAG TPA: alpha/beta fold hydrolase [Metabacillus sp.]|nr:alpha/beta fold hydrolase [Metabacillus sp.]
MSIATYDQGIIHYEEQGKGEPLILIHGVGLDHTMWEKQVKRLSGTFRVICYDMIGHGGSEHPPGPYSLAQFVDQLLALMNYLQIKKCHLVGFSMGGMVAQSFALKHQEKLKSLTIMSAVANRTDEQTKAILSRVEEVKQYGPLGTIEPAIKRWFTPEFLKTEKEIVAKIKNRLQTNNPKSYLDSYTLFATADQELWPILHRIDVPTLIITGQHDVGSNSLMAKQMHEQIKNSELVIVDNMKHMLPVEDAETVNDVIQKFIKRQQVISAK